MAAGEGPAYPGSSAGKPRSAAGEGPAYPESKAGNPRVIDKRTVAQKLKDAQARSMSRFDRKLIPKNSSVSGKKVDG